MSIQILLVDDDEVIRDLVIAHLNLQLSNIQITQVCSSKDAMSIIQNNRSIECMITDLQMPDGSGFDIVDFLRQERLSVPTIVFSGSDFQPYMESFKPPIVSFCAKPDFQLLRSTVELIMHR